MLLTIAAVIILIIFGLFASTDLIKEKEENAAKVPGDIAMWAPTVRRYASKYNIPFPVAMAIMWVESAGQPDARGSAGEYGLYQLKDIAVKDVSIHGYGNFDFYQQKPEENIQAGLAFLDLQRRRTGNLPDAIKAYNQGFEGMKRNPVKAQNYLEKVKAKQRFFE